MVRNQNALSPPFSSADNSNWKSDCVRALDQVAAIDMLFN